MREAFFNKLYEIAKKDKNLILVSPDMGDPGSNLIKKNLDQQYVNTGIAEQSAVLIAAGLALSGKKPYVYTISPFVTWRIGEFIKIELGLMNLPITLVGVGSGFSYSNAGPTHHSIEDISLRAIPNLNIFNPSDNHSAKAFAEQTYKLNEPCYVRLDRQPLPQIYDNSETFEEGFKELKKGKDVCIISTGNMVHTSLEIQKNLETNGEKIGIIDIYRLKPINQNLLKETLKKYKKIISLEEHVLEGGLGSIMSEIITDNQLDLKLKRIGLEGYTYEYGGREHIQKLYGIDTESVINKLKDFK